MNFSSILALKEHLRKYNSHSILKMGTDICWHEWENWRESPYGWTESNARRNYAIRLILLASAGTPHRSQNITAQEFENLIQIYFDWPHHTISDKTLLDKEAQIIAESIVQWENNHQNLVRNWTVKLSDFFIEKKVRSHGFGFFGQRLVAFQNAGLGKLIARIQRTIKFLEIINESHPRILENFSDWTGLSQESYFNQFLFAIGWGLKSLNNQKGFFDFSQSINIEKDLERIGITQENLEKFVAMNSRPFNLSTKQNSDCFYFWTQVEGDIKKVEEPYQPFFYNALLDTPFIYLGKQKYCLPDPFSLTESGWSQIYTHVLCKYEKIEKKRNGFLSKAFETYLETIFLPEAAPNSFERIPTVQKPQKPSDKRADFLVRLPNAYLIIECKNSLMPKDVSTFFYPKGLASLYGIFHKATEQISATIKAHNLTDKPVIPLILSFYDAMAASQTFEFLVRETDYCSTLGLKIPPIIQSLHEFENSTHDRDLENWAELMLWKAQQPIFVPPNAQGQSHSSGVLPNNKGHEYRHLEDCEFFTLHC